MKKSRGKKADSVLSGEVGNWYEALMKPTIVPQTMMDDYMKQYERMLQAVSGQVTAGALGGLPAIQEKPPSVDAAKLEALKTAEPYRVQKRMPDYVHVITAWRGWRAVWTDDGLRLKALGQNHIWQPKKQMDADCVKSDPSPFMQAFAPGRDIQIAPKHPAPQMNCECGVWAFKEIDSLVAAIGSNYADVRVLGQVSLWGRVVETENGYRAQHAYPSELWLLDSSLEELGLIYDVPVRSIASK